LAFLALYGPPERSSVRMCEGRNMRTARAGNHRHPFSRQLLLAKDGKDKAGERPNEIERRGEADADHWPL